MTQMRKNAASLRSSDSEPVNGPTEYFVDTTTMHGVKQIWNAPRYVLRVIWVMIFLAMACLMVWNTTKQVTKYFSYPYQTSVSIQALRRAEFPAVTVCNINSAKRSLIDGDAFWKDLLQMENITANRERIERAYKQPSKNDSLKPGMAEDGQPHVNNVGPSYYDADGSQDCADSYKIMGNMSSEDYKNLTKILTKILESSTSSDLSDIINLISLPPDAVKKFGYKQEEFIVECTFDQKPCKDEDFTQSYDKSYGNCYTFNLGRNSSIKQTNLYGSSYGLRLSLDLNISEYIGLLSSEYGARISIQTPKAEESPLQDGFNAAPGQLTAVGVKRSNMTRLPSPYLSGCINEFPQEYAPYVIPGSTYTYNGCWQACLNKFLLRNCSCMDWSSNIVNKSADHCNLFNETNIGCYKQILKEVHEVNRNAKKESQYYCHGCGYPCVEYSFDRTISTSGWPTEPYKYLQVAQKPTSKISQIMYNDVATAEAEDCLEEWNGTGSYTANYAEMNVVRLHIYFETLDVIMIGESASYPLTQLFAELGGVLGLYLGVSIATLFEVLQYILITSLKIKPKLK